MAYGTLPPSFTSYSDNRLLLPTQAHLVIAVDLGGEAVAGAEVVLDVALREGVAEAVVVVRLLGSSLSRILLAA